AHPGRHRLLRRGGVHHGLRERLAIGLAPLIEGDIMVRRWAMAAAALVLLGGTCALADGWKAGVARATITPNESMCMAGYADRALRGAHPRPLVQGARPGGRSGASGRARLARPLRYLKAPIGRGPRRAPGEARARTPRDRPGLLAHAHGPGDAREPDHHVSPR